MGDRSPKDKAKKQKQQQVKNQNKSNKNVHNIDDGRAPEPAPENDQHRKAG